MLDEAKQGRAALEVRLRLRSDFCACRTAYFFIFIPTVVGETDTTVDHMRVGGALKDSRGVTTSFGGKYLPVHLPRDRISSLLLFC